MRKRFVFFLMAIVLVPSLGRADRSWADSVAVQRDALVALHSGKAMDVPKATHDPGAQIIQWTFHGHSNQTWKLLPFAPGSNYYVIVSNESGLVLDVAQESTADGARVIQWPWHGGLNQLWIAVPFSELVPGGNPGLYVILSALSAKALDVSRASTADGAPLIQWPWHGGPNQIWQRLTVMGTP